MTRLSRWILAAAIAAAAGGLAGTVYAFLAEAARRRGDEYLLGLAYGAAGLVAVAGVSAIVSLFAPSEGA